MAVVEQHGRVMASELHMVAVVETEAEIEAVGSVLFERPLRLLGHLEDKWSRFIPSSDISRINRVGTTGGGVVPVDRSTLRLLEVMVEGFAGSAGRFDPTQLPALLAEGYSASIDDPTAVSRLGPFAASRTAIFDMSIDESAELVVVPAGLTLDPGGIGKGLAADMVVDLLRSSGAAGALVSIGGDLFCEGGSPTEEGWLVDVERPEPTRIAGGRLALDGGGVATSSLRSRRWTNNGEERHHQIDPRTGTCSTSDLDSVTVIAQTGWLAEVHSTAALGIGSDGVISYLDGHGISGIAQCRDGRTLTTPDLDLYPLRQPETVT